MQKLRKTKVKEKIIPSDSKVVFIEALRLKYPKFDKAHNIVFKIQNP